MKPQPAPNVPGDTEFERFDNVVRHVLTISKEQIVKAEEKWKKAKAKERSDKK